MHWFMIPWTQYCGRSVASGAQRWRCSTNRCRSMNERINVDECTTATSRYSCITLTHFPCDNHYLLPKQHHHKQTTKTGFTPSWKLVEQLIVLKRWLGISFLHKWFMNLLRCPNLNQINCDAWSFKLIQTFCEPAQKSWSE